MGQSQSSWEPEAKKKVRPQPAAGKGNGKCMQELQRKAAAVEEHMYSKTKKKQAFHAYPSKDGNLVLTVSLDAITRIG